MGGSWNIIGWGVIAIVVSFAVGVVLFILAIYAKQWFEDVKRKRAHAGKVKCETSTEKCEKIATFVTPNGYSCDDHEGVMSKKYISVGSVQYAHRLNYTINSQRQR